MNASLAGFLGIALRVLSARLLAFLALGMSFGLFCWALYLQTWISFAMAATFGVSIFLPVLFRSGESNHAEDE